MNNIWEMFSTPHIAPVIPVCGTYMWLGVHVGLVLQEQGDHVSVALLGRQVQRCEPVLLTQGLNFICGNLTSGTLWVSQNKYLIKDLKKMLFTIWSFLLFIFQKWKI